MKDEVGYNEEVECMIWSPLSSSPDTASQVGKETSVLRNGVNNALLSSHRELDSDEAVVPLQSLDTLTSVPFVLDLCNVVRGPTRKESGPTVLSPTPDDEPL